MDKRSVEFSPGTVGSGEKDMDVGLKTEAPLEQSDTELRATGESRKAVRANRRLILHHILCKKFRPFNTTPR
jgi:hypothetical protein